jgi:hypothetical protein
MNTIVVLRVEATEDAETTSGAGVAVMLMMMMLSVLLLLLFLLLLVALVVTLAPTLETWTLSRMHKCVCARVDVSMWAMGRAAGAVVWALWVALVVVAVAAAAAVAVVVVIVARVSGCGWATEGVSQCLNQSHDSTLLIHMLWRHHSTECK